MEASEKKKKPKCHNCKHRGPYFRVNGQASHHCEHPKWNEEDMRSGETSPWDTFKAWWDTCSDHEFKTEEQ